MTKYRCERCYNLFSEDSMMKVATTEHVCLKCARRWYVIAVEPGEDDRAKREIYRLARRKGLAHLIDQILIPKQKEAETTKTTWEVALPSVKIPYNALLGYVTAETESEAKDKARSKFPDDYDRIVTKVKEGGKLRVLSRKYLNGYLLMHGLYTEKLYDLMYALRGKGVLGLLPHRPRPKAPRDPNNPTIQEEKDIQDAERWYPTPLNTEEEALALIREQERKGEVKPSTNGKYAVGDEVVVVNGGFRGSKGKVKEFGGTKSDPKVTVTLQIIGRPVDNVFSQWQIAKA